MSVTQPNWHAIALVLLFLMYTLHLVRSNKLNSQLGVKWLLGEMVLLVFFFYSDTEMLSDLSNENLPNSAMLGFVWLAILVLKGHSHVLSLTAKLKDINQELALVRERLGRVEENNSDDNDARRSHRLKSTPDLICSMKSELKETTSPIKLLVANLWVMGVLYVFAVYSTLVPPYGVVGRMLTSLFESLKAGYLQ